MIWVMVPIAPPKHIFKRIWASQEKRQLLLQCFINMSCFVSCISFAIQNKAWRQDMIQNTRTHIQTQSYPYALVKNTNATTGVTLATVFRSKTSCNSKKVTSMSVFRSYYFSVIGLIYESKKFQASTSSSKTFYL